jgi:hypothetical protein
VRHKQQVVVDGAVHSQAGRTAGKGISPTYRQTHRHINTDIYRHTYTQTHSQTHTDIHIHTQIHRHRHTHTHRDTNTQTYKHRYTQSDVWPRKWHYLEVLPCWTRCVMWAWA